MTEKEKAQALLMYMRGYSYVEIARKLGVSRGNVRHYLLRNLEVIEEDQTPVAEAPWHIRNGRTNKKHEKTKIEEERKEKEVKEIREDSEKKQNDQAINLPKCKTCGQQILTPGRGYGKKFCSTECRMKYWHTHREETHWSVVQELICPICGKTFKVNGRVKRVYCSRDCANEAQRHRKGSRQH